MRQISLQQIFRTKQFFMLAKSLQFNWKVICKESINIALAAILAIF